MDSLGACSTVEGPWSAAACLYIHSHLRFRACEIIYGLMDSGGHTDMMICIATEPSIQRLLEDRMGPPPIDDFSSSGVISECD